MSGFTASRRHRSNAIELIRSCIGDCGRSQIRRQVGSLKELFPAAAKVVEQNNHPTLQIDDAPRGLAALRCREGMGAWALEFAVLIAALWIIPVVRMTMEREHRVPLTSEVVTLLNALPLHQDNPLVFPAPRGGELSDMTLNAAWAAQHLSRLGGRAHVVSY